MGQSTLDLLWDSTLINPISPLFFARVHAEIISDKPIGQAPNPIQMPEVSPPQTISGGITHGVSQFIVGFIPAVRVTHVIGKFYDRNSNTFIPTTNFTIHYSKTGVHIVQARP